MNFFAGCTRALGNMQYLTINTRSNRVVINSSVITRIFFISVQCLDSHISTCFNKDTRDFFYVVHNARVPVISCSILLLLFNFHLSFVRLLFDFVFIRFFAFNCFLAHCSLFKRKLFNSNPGLYSRYFNHTVPLYRKYHHHLCKSINIIHQTAPTLS